MAEARLFVLSDLHAHDERFTTPLAHAAPQTSPGKPSWLEYSDRAPSERDPILSLLKLIQDARISAQFLLIPGDICHQANGAALRLAWDDIERIRDALGADATIATAGNHDLDSRYRVHPYDPRNALQCIFEPEATLGSEGESQEHAWASRTKLESGTDARVL